MKYLSMKTKMSLAVSLMFVAAVAILAWCMLFFLEKSFDKTALTQQLAFVSSYFLLAAVAITIAVLAITWFMMRRLTAPLVAIVREVESLPDTLGTHHLADIDSGDEIGALAQAFNRMAMTMERQQVALRESNERFAKAFHNTPSILAITTTAGGRYVEVNETFELLIGYRREEAIGRTSLELNIWEDADVLPRAIRTLSEEGTVRDIEVGLRSKNGDHFVGLLSADIIEMNGEECALVQVNDITTRKKAEESVRLNEARLEALARLNDMAEASLHEITDFALEEAVRLTGSAIGYLAFMNEDETVLTMYSWSREAMAECAINDKPIVYKVANTGLWGEAVRQRRPVITNDYAASNPCKKGYPAGHVEMRRHMNAPIFDGERIVVVAGVGNKEERYDETDVRQLTLLMQGMWRLVQRKRVQEALAIKQRQLEELNGCLEARIFSAVNDLRQKDQALIQQSRLAVMGEMINNIAHQWRQPLNNIGLIVQGIGFNMESGELNRSEVREDVENIMDLIVFMSSTIDDFSNFFRQDKQRHSFSINKSVNSALDFIGAGLKSSNIRVDLQADDKVTVTGYRNEYAQVLLNVLSNARDVLLERKVSDPAIYIRISSEEDRSIVTISDNAGGIPEDILPRIFDPYFTTKEIGKGTGIGLYMSKVIIEQNIGGSLTVCNTDVGAEFRIEV